MTDVLTALQGDFKLFLQALWTQLDLPEPTRAQYAIADYLQSGPKRLQICLLYTSPSPRDKGQSRMPSSA